MLKKTERSLNSSLGAMRRASRQAEIARARQLDSEIAFIDLELLWVSSDSVGASLEMSRRALCAERNRLNIPATR